MPNEQSDTIVGANVELKGSLKNQGPIHIHGRVTGDVISDSNIIIGETAVVAGPVSAKTVEVFGQVHGSITVEQQVELHPKSYVKGDITSGRLSVKPGAIFIGKSQMNVPTDVVEELTTEEPIEKKNPRVEIE